MVVIVPPVVGEVVSVAPASVSVTLASKCDGGKRTADHAKASNCYRDSAHPRKLAAPEVGRHTAFPLIQ